MLTLTREIGSPGLRPEVRWITVVYYIGSTEPGDWRVERLRMSESINVKSVRLLSKLI